MRRVIAALAFIVCAAASASAAEFRAASAAEGAAIVGARDEVTRLWTRSDISIRLARTDRLRERDVRALYAAATRDWTADESARLAAMVARHRAALDALDDYLPDEVLFIKNTDDIDAGMPHTRANAILFGPTLPEPDEGLDELFLHELWHVISRANAARHDEMYALLGFAACAEISTPGALRRRALHNPDAPIERWAAPLPGGGYVMPMLLADPPRFSPDERGFPGYFDLEFRRVARDARGRCTIGEELERGAATDAIFAAAGRNTAYVLHPEELLADNFAQAMMGRADAPNPEIYDRLFAWLGVSAPVRD